MLKKLFFSFNSVSFCVILFAFVCCGRVNVISAIAFYENYNVDVMVTKIGISNV